MKKLLSILILMVFVVAANFAQEATTTSVNDKLVTKKGISILPQAGEIALGIDAYPFLDYIGNMLSTNGSSAPYTDYAAGHSGYPAIYVKYMLTNNSALRARLGIVQYKDVDLYPVVKSSLTPDAMAPEFVNDEVAYQYKSYVLSLGYEKLRGNSRIQGKYGAEVFVNFNKNDQSIQYGNPINNDFATPAISYGGYSGGMRLVENNYYQRINLGARAFLGFEFFVLPKLSLGGEFGYSFRYGKGGVQEYIYEYWDGASNSVKNYVTKDNYDAYKFVGIDTDNLDGALTIYLYF